MKSQLQRAAKINCDSFHGGPTFDEAAELYKERWLEATASVLAFFRRREQIDAAEIGTGRKPGRPPAHDWQGLAVGGSFVMERGEDGKNRFGLAYTSKRYWERKLGRKYKVKAVENGLEVMRIL